MMISDPKCEEFESTGPFIFPEPGLTSVGAKHIAEALRNNTNLKELILDGHTEINDEGALSFASMLLQNTTLEYLSLRDCGLTDIGVNSLAYAIKRNKTLKGLRIDTNCITAGHLYIEKAAKKRGIPLSEHIPMDRCMARLIQRQEAK
jgi:Ran GTPase-activating protein (RanGAP) involved in mRNA processing and transport